VSAVTTRQPKSAGDEQTEVNYSPVGRKGGSGPPGWKACSSHGRFENPQKWEMGKGQPV